MDFAQSCRGVTYALIIFLSIVALMVHHLLALETFWVHCLLWGNLLTYILLYFYSFSAYSERHREFFELVAELYVIDDSDSPSAIV